ncbi:MAG TPA: KTSC domain-containing protein [Anaerolineae bacterium]|nr:KTSC domain-containing protein [Anaerolineae bacterium]HIP71046.1 KTSC domain-containing protein [Anaerolineae bacterium]
MKRTPVSSSSLASVGYDSESQVLEIEFNTGRVYQYFDVPQSEYDGLMAADSHGSYFYHNVRSDNRYARIR